MNLKAAFALLFLLAIFNLCNATTNGLNGADGRDGRHGKDGTDGTVKVIGLKPGQTPKKGPPGPQGPAGTDGRPGTPGFEGSRGRVGDPGPKGPSGSSGPDGIGSSMEDIGRLIEETIKKQRGGGGGSHTSGGTTDSIDKNRYSVCTEFEYACGDCECREKNFDDEFYGRDYYCDCQNMKPERDCLQHRMNERYSNGIYLVNPGSTSPYPVFCDMMTEGGGWTVIQRRSSGDVSFNRDWFAYNNGFGNLQAEFWLGLKQIYLTQLYDDRMGTELWIEAIDIHGKGYRIRYSLFEIGDESTKYKLNVDGYSGDGGDWMADYKGFKFSTFDNDNDVSGSNLALTYGPFWMGSNYYLYHPNRPYQYKQVSTKSNSQPQQRVFQAKINKKENFLQSLEMKIRRKA